MTNLSTDAFGTIDTPILSRQIVSAFLRHKRLFVKTILIVMAAVIALAYIKRPSYESTARLLVKLDQTDVSLTQSETHYQIAAKMAEEAVATEAEMLGGVGLIAEVVDTLGPDIFNSKKSDNALLRLAANIVSGVQNGIMTALSSIGLIPDLSERDKAINTIQKDLKIFPVRRTQVIELAFRSKNAEATKKVLSALIQLHNKKLEKLNNYSEDYEFYQHQTNKLETELHTATANIVEFKNKHNIVDLPAEKAMLLQRLESLTSIMDGVISTPVAAGPQQDSGGALGQGLLATNKITPETAPQSSNDILQLATRLNDLKIEIARRKTLYESSHAQTKELDNQISSITSILNKQVTHLNTTINQYKTRLKVLGQLEPELNRLTRAYSAAEEHYRVYSKATEERRLAREQASRIIVLVIDPPILPHTPVSSSRLVTILIGVFASLLIAATTILIREWLEVRGLMPTKNIS